MSKRDLILLLNDILLCCVKIKKYTNGYTKDDFINDDKTIDAVARNFAIIGEAVSNIDNDFKYINPQIEWREIKDFRNRIVHDYTGIDESVVWEIVANYIDELEFQIQELINNLDSNHTE
jgi:uncharacterized protein with HEPN domain